MNAPESTRRYGWIDPAIRETAVAAVRDLLPHVRSQWQAFCVVSKQVSVHPNTIRNWYLSALNEQDTPEPGTALHVSTKKAEQQALERLSATLKDLGTSQ
ncbi:transposase [Gordonia paraffinivorans]|uniref:transposase n=1 Tax=Gordonia paraffinivorans TaxID=175628 RepID=UPI001C92DB6D|nr:transposase [Gordonia paraffinivorans]MBY4575995.1 transposase [Gordonia paraffinivorans]